MCHEMAQLLHIQHLQGCPVFLQHVSSVLNSDFFSQYIKNTAHWSDKIIIVCSTDDKRKKKGNIQVRGGNSAACRLITSGMGCER